MRIYEKNLGENYYYLAICENGYLDRAVAYIDHVASVWQTMVNLFGQKPYFKRYCILFTDKTHLNRDYDGAFYLPGGLIFIKPDDAVIRGEPDFLWGGVIHEVIHAFLEPLKWFPGGQLDFQRQNFIEGIENSYEGFNLVIQKQLYDTLSKPELVEKLLIEQAGNEFFNLLDSIVQKKGYSALQRLFERIKEGEKFEQIIWQGSKTDLEIVEGILSTR